MTAIERFIATLEDVPLFEQLGKPSRRDREVFRIYDWDTWPGPENPGSELQAAYHSLWRERLFEGVESQLAEELDALWDEIHATVLSLARLKVEYDDAQDAWYGPNNAAWSASWMASLVGCTMVKRGSLEQGVNPEMQWTLHNEWSWYAEGHWPCMFYWPWGYTDIQAVEGTSGHRRLVIY